MKKKNWAFFAITAVLLALTLIAFRPSSTAVVESRPTMPTCCKKARKCTGTQKDSKATPNQFYPESLSQQFIFINPSVY
ncbi:MAG: hypothetical protein ABIT05_01910 [Chitinophagaceae bacterium]